MLDVLIRNGTVVDGTGRPGVRAEVAIRGQRIVAVAPTIDEPSRRTIDAEGLVVTPGFVDIHTHFDGQATWDADLRPSSDFGVTSIVMGNCGVGFAPATVGARNSLIELLEGVEDIPGTALHEGISWEWESFPQYLDALERRSFTLDVSAMIGHAPLRLFAMGPRGGDPDAVANEAEINEMARLVRWSVEAGAIGFATSRTVAHKTKAGAPIGTLRATDAELCGIAGGLRKTAGVVQLVSDAYRSDDDDFVDAEMQLVEEMAVLSGRPLSLSVMQTDWAPDRWRDVFSRLDELNRRSVTVRAQVAPRPIGIFEGFDTSLNPFADCPTYRSLAPLPLEQRLAELRRPDVRLRVVGEHGGAVDRVRNALLSDFDKMFPTTDPMEYEPSPDDSIAARAARAGESPAEVAYDTLLEQGGGQLLYMPIFNWAHRNLDDVGDMLHSPHSLIGLSDAGAHCGTICDASFPITLLSHWVQGRSPAGRLSLEFAVHLLTQRNAAHVGWLDRGVVAPGFLADINLLDIDALELSPPRMVQDLPAGGRRLLQGAGGVVATIKRGELTLDDGAHTGRYPGRLVRGPQAAVC